jgi:hypothetical protein
MLKILSLLILSSCALNRAPGMKMLEKVADYQSLHRLENDLGSASGPLLLPKRTNALVTDIWIHPHEMPTGDYFRGGWIRTIISRASWKLEKSRPLMVKKKLRSRKSRKTR